MSDNLKEQYTALVTGGAGFIGSHLMEALLGRRCPVATVDNFDHFYPRARKLANLDEVARAGKFILHEVDIRDFATLRTVFENVRPEVVIHIAARAGVGPSVEQPKIYEEVNIGGTLNLLMLAREFEVKKFVFMSSSSVYGATERVPFVEDDHELMPLSPYAATKIAGELLCYTYSHLHGLSVVSLRLFSVYGPRQRPDLALHVFASHLESGRPIPIFGDGTSGRDYTYVDDVVAGILAAAEYETPYEVFNIGNSQPVKVLDLVQALEKVAGKQAELNFLPPRLGDVPLTWGDISKARRLLGYNPRTTLEAGIERFLTWYRRA